MLIDDVRKMLTDRHIEYRVIDPNCTIYIDDLCTRLFVDVNGTCWVGCETFRYAEGFADLNALCKGLLVITDWMSNHYSDRYDEYMELCSSVNYMEQRLRLFDSSQKGAEFMKRLAAMKEAGVCDSFKFRGHDWVLGMLGDETVIQLAIGEHFCARDIDLEVVNGIH